MSNITPNWVTLLLPFTVDYAARLTASDLAKASGVPQQTASRILNQLAAENLLRYERHGRNKLYYFDLQREETLLLLSTVEQHKTLQFLKEGGLETVEMRELAKICDLTILFGSYASGTADEQSDLDVVFLGKVTEKRLQEIKNMSTIEINTHNVTPRYFRKLLKEDHALAHEIRKNHVLFGDVSKMVEIFIQACG